MQRGDQGQPEPGALLGGLGGVAEQGVGEGLQPAGCPAAAPGAPGDRHSRRTEAAGSGRRAASLQRGQAGVRRDPVSQVRSDASSRVVAVGRPPGPQQGLLHQVLGLVDGAEHPVAVCEQLTAVAVGRPLELDPCRHRPTASHRPPRSPAP